MIATDALQFADTNADRAKRNELLADGFLDPITHALHSIASPAFPGCMCLRCADTTKAAAP